MSLLDARMPSLKDKILEEERAAKEAADKLEAEKAKLKVEVKQPKKRRK